MAEKDSWRGEGPIAARASDQEAASGGTAYAAYQSTRTLVGTIRDIGLSGLSIEYIFEELEKGESGQVAIWDSQGFSLSSLPCKVIDQVVARASQPPFFGPEVRRCVLQFQGLTEDQVADLRHFLARQERSLLDEMEAGPAFPPTRLAGGCPS